MEDMDDVQASNQEDSDIDDIWEPESLQKEYKQNADDDITSPKQYEKVNLLVKQLTRYSTFSKTSTSFFSFRMTFEKNKRDEPKGIVFFSHLLLLFQRCHKCFGPNPQAQTSHSGTMFVFDVFAMQSSPGKVNQTLKESFLLEVFF